MMIGKISGIVRNVRRRRRNVPDVEKWFHIMRLMMDCAKIAVKTLCLKDEPVKNAVVLSL